MLREGVARKLVVSKRQVLAAVRQAERYASWFEELLRQFDRRRADHDTRLGGDQQQLDSLRRELASGVSEAAGGYAALGAYLHDEYLPCAREADGVGRALYSRQIEDYFGGSGLDLDDCYRWGWAELARVRAEMESLTRLRGGELAEHLAQLSSTDVFAVPRDRFVPTIVQLQRDAVEQLDGRHFDIPPAARSIDVELVTSSSGGAQGALYRRAAVDGSRRGALVFNVGSAEPVPMFTHTSTAYHEGFPGHHMQHALQIAQGARLTRLHRELFVCHAFYEGWALYAERLMSELGFFRTLHERLGFLHQQRMRAARVVVDIGIHLGLDIPAGNPDFDAPPGTRWDFDRAVACLQSVGIAPARALSEVERYCGLPGQAICYKLGEREILRARQRFAHLTTKVFHRRLLQMGTVPLDLIECLLSSTDER